MSTNDLQAKIKDLRELQRMAEEVQQEIDTIKDMLKNELISRNAEEIITGEYKVTYKEVKSSRLDGTALKKAMPDLYKQFSKETITRRFNVA